MCLGVTSQLTLCANSPIALLNSQPLIGDSSPPPSPPSWWRALLRRLFGGAGASAAGAEEARFAPRAGEVAVDLLPVEASALVLNLPAICTATFSEGDAAAAEAHLRARVEEVLRLNPWLLGRLALARGASGEPARLRLLHAAAAPPGAAARVFGVADAPGLGLGEDAADYAATARRLLHLRVPQGVACLAAAGARDANAEGSAEAPPPPPLLRVTLVRASARRFAVFFSFSHVAGDGATFYELHKQLGLDEAPRALRCARVDAARYETAADALMGGKRGAVNEAVQWILTPGSIFRILVDMLFGAPPRAALQRVPAEWVAGEKRRFSSPSPSPAAAAAPETPFVSTNDVVMAALARLSGDNLLFMAANLRGRVAGVDRELAGNYETMVPLLPEDVASAACVRRAVAGGRLLRASPAAPLPGFFAALLRTRACVVTNWSSFYRDVRLPGAQLLRHLPVAELHSANMESAVVFAPRAGETEVVWLTRNARVTEAAMARAFAPA